MERQAQPLHVEQRDPSEVPAQTVSAFERDGKRLPTSHSFDDRAPGPRSDWGPQAAQPSRPPANWPHGRRVVSQRQPAPSYRTQTPYKKPEKKKRNEALCQAAVRVLGAVGIPSGLGGITLG
jgi:hypothetical protein